jgi:hypothetical protein
MGLGSRRVMGLGLPLMRILTRSQFRAVLAHEFGHYHGGDTKIGPWIYKTRAAIVRTLHSLGNGSWLQAPFRWYGKMFLRITHAVSRRQEFVADELAARTVGARPFADGLRTIHKVAPAFDFYWRTECSPVLRAGFLPPLADGFEQFSKAGNISKKMDELLEEELTGGKGNPYDTHPPLKERIAAVASLPAGPALPEDRHAVSLLENVPALERELMAQIAGAEQAAKLKYIAWDEVGSHVYVPQWTRLTQLNANAILGVTPESLPTLASGLKAFGKKLVDFSQEKPDHEQAESLAKAVVGSAMMVLLIQRGGKLDATPGSDISVTLNGRTVKTFDLLQSLKNGGITANSWSAQCAALNIIGVDLGTVAPPATVEADKSF